MGMRKHWVKPGETLATIAEKYYGDQRAFAYIYRANDQYIDNPNVLAVGQVLVIPHLPILDSIEQTIHNLING